MNQSNNTKIVNFQYWCEKCKYRNTAASEDPCHECLEYPVNFQTDQPVQYISASDE